VKGEGELARLCDVTPAEQDERIALRDALRSLRGLFPERSQPDEERDENAKTAGLQR